jgi:hypothetical protein
VQSADAVGQKKSDEETDYGTGEFFEVLRALEEQIDLHEELKKGLVTAVKGLAADFSALSGKNRRDADALGKIREQFEDAHNIFLSRQSELVSLKQKLSLMDFERGDLLARCADVKQEIATLSEQTALNHPADELARLAALKERLQTEIKVRGDHLAKLKLDNRSQKAKLTVQRGRLQKEVEKTESPRRWMSDRAALMAKIKTAQNELRVLCEREKGVTATADFVAAANKKYDADDVKRAIVAEIRQLNSRKDTFLLDSIEHETQTSERFQKEIAEIDETQSAMSAYHAEAAKAREFDMCAADEQRIQLLKEELRELMPKIE